MDFAIKRKRRLRRAAKTRYRLNMVAKTRITISRSNKHFTAQLIRVEDKLHHVVCAVSTAGLKDASDNKTTQAEQLGEAMGKKMIELGFKDNLAFDRSGYKYHGRVKAFADAVRAQGVLF